MIEELDNEIKAGFDLYLIDEKQREVELVSDNEIDGRLNPLGYMNLLCTRS